MRIADRPPLIYHLAKKSDRRHRLDAERVFASYRHRLPPERLYLLDRYELRDIAFKVVDVPFYRSSWLRWLEFGLGFTRMFSKVVVNSKTMEDEYRRIPDWCRAHVVRIEHGFEPKTTIETGLARFVQWYREYHGPG